VTAADLGIRPVAAWQREFSRAWAHTRPVAERWSLSGDSWEHYRLGFYLDALTAMYRATGEDRYLDQALTMSENLVRTASPSASLPGSQFQDRFRGWASHRPETRGQEVPLYESVAWRYVTNLLRAMRSSGAEWRPRYADRYGQLLRFAEHDVFDKWYARGASAYIYRSNTHMAAHWAFIAMNLSVLTKDPARRRRYDTVVHDVNDGLPNYDSSLHQQLTANPADPHAYFWGAEWGGCDCRPGADVAHANGVVAYVVAARALHRGWTHEDIAHLVLTLTRVVWPVGQPAAAYLDGSGRGNGWFSDGFVKLGRYDLSLERRLEHHHPANVQFMANCALNTRLLLDRYRQGSTAGQS